MRAILPLFLLCLPLTASAKEWKNPFFHCGANIPDSPGWQMIDAPPAAGIAPVLVMQNTARRAVFGINVVEKFRGANLSDPAVQKELEAMLRQFGYQFIGHATVNVGGVNWLQYPVRSGEGPQQVSGQIRYASLGGYLFGISMLRGGSPEVSQDAELQQAAASFHILPAGTAAANGTPAPSEQPAGADDDPGAEDNSQARMIWAGGAGLVVLVLFLSIIAKKPTP